jgi:hypothetical protein
LDLFGFVDGFRVYLGISFEALGHPSPLHNFLLLFRDLENVHKFALPRSIRLWVGTRRFVRFRVKADRLDKI